MTFILGLVSSFWGLITKYPKEALILVIVLVMAYMYWDIHSLNGKLATATADNKTFSDANTKLNGEVSDQNKSILALQAAGDAWAAKLAAANQTAATAQTAAATTLAAMKKQVTPKTCDGAMQRLLDDAVARKKAPL